jgi:hypothetical protein
MRLSIVPSVFSLILLTALLGCSGAVTRQAAVDEAIKSVSSSTPVTAMDTRLSTFGVEAPTSQLESADTPVWAVTLAGTFDAPSCGPAGATQCPTPYRTAFVMINARTGAFILASLPAPAPTPAAT